VIFIALVCDVATLKQNRLIISKNNFFIKRYFFDKM
jgi:hypothetical protein